MIITEKITSYYDTVQKAVEEILSLNYIHIRLIRSDYYKRHICIFKARNIQTGKEEKFLVKTLGLTNTNFIGDTFVGEVEGYNLVQNIIPNNIPKRLGFKQLGTNSGVIIYEFLDVRAVTSKDLPACQDLLSRLHEQLVIHGDTDCVNILVNNSNNDIILIDFAQTKQYPYHSTAFEADRSLELLVLTALIGACSEC